MTFERLKMANRILITALLAACAPGVACNDSKGSRDAGETTRLLLGEENAARVLRLPL